MKTATALFRNPKRAPLLVMALGLALALSSQPTKADVLAVNRVDQLTTDGLGREVGHKFGAGPRAPA